jgi:ABC-type multidrug transport system fused ATPase/permease subunit
MIGQDPTILSGTLRSNLDVDGCYSDDELYNTLRQVRLIRDDGEQQREMREGFVNVFENLDTVVQPGGLK